MSLVSSIVCVNCYQLYDESRKPCLGTCHDSVCQQCRQEMKVFTCPVCGKKDAFKEEKVNWNGIPMQEAILTDLTEDNIEKFIKKDKNSGPCQECGELAKILRICLDCAIEQEVLIPQAHYLTINLKSNVTALGAFFKAKQFSICADCAADGRHADHEIDSFAKVYDERMVDRELDFVLRRIVNLKHGKETEKHEEGSDWNWLYKYKQDVMRIEMYRESGLIFPSEDELDLTNSGEELKEVRGDASLYQRRQLMMYVDEVRRRHADSEDEEFRKELEGVIERMLTEEEKLGVEEMGKVEELVKERILKHCEMEGENGVEDFKKAVEELEKARVVAQRLLDDCLTSPMDDNTVQLITAEEFEKGNAIAVDEEMRKEMREELEKNLPEDQKELLEVFDQGQVVYSFGEEHAELKRKYSLAQLDYYKARAHHTLCALVFMETKEMVEGRGIQLEHPGLQKYLELFKQQFEQDIQVDKCCFSSVLHFP